MSRLLNAYREWVRRTMADQRDGATRWQEWLAWLHEVPPQAYSDHRVRDVTRRTFRASAAALEEDTA